MKIYIIDTIRIAFWHDLNRNDVCRVCDENKDTQWSFDADDIIFAHSHRNIERDNRDLVLSALASNWPVVQNFCRALVAASKSGVTPFIVLYSGGDINPNWKTIAVETDAALHGFPDQRIQCYPKTIHRNECKGEILEMVQGVLTQLEAGGDGTPINLDTSWLEEVKLAARLLVEAADSKPEDFPGIDITKPTEPLLSAARKVIEAVDRQQNIVPSAKALCEALGCPHPTQP